MKPFNIDRMRSWHDPIDQEIRDLLPPDFRETIRGANPEFLEDAGEMVFEAGGEPEIAGRVVDWLESQSVAAFHGTRLDPEAIRNIREYGLKKLNPDDRISRLERALSCHPDWPAKGYLLPNLLKELGNGQYGKREGQVHFCISRSELITGCNHYLVEGSEIDSHVARMSFGNEGLELVKKGREPTIVEVAMPGKRALEAANPYGFEVVVPELVREIVNRWAFRIANPDWDSSSSPPTQALMFFEDIPADWIRRIESVPEELLMRHYRHPDPEMRGM